MVFRLFCLCFLLTNVIAWQFRRNAQERMMLNREALLPGGFEIQPTSNKSLPRTKHPIAVHSVEELKRLIRGGYGVQDVDVRGDVCDLVHTNQTKLHPVVKLFHERKRAGSTAGNRKDNHKLAIAIEGGGMRGCVGAGMITAVWYLGLTDCVDVVYGSSAGSLVGAYFIAQQLPYEGPEIYYDILTSHGKQFIDKKAVLRSAGLGLLDLRPKQLWQLFTDRMGKPVFDLSYLFDRIVKTVKPLNWEVFWRKQVTGELPLKIVASGLLSRKSVVLSAEQSNFRDLDELSQCMKASMCLPGIAGDAIRLQGRQLEGGNVLETVWPEYHKRKRFMTYGSEPLVDAQVFEPIPYRSALREGCSHVLVLRSRADGINVAKKLGLLEKLIVKRFFTKKLKLPVLEHWMKRQFHKLIYAEDILRLNAGNRDYDNDSKDPKLFCIALPKGLKEVARSETSRSVILDNVRHGFASAFDSLVEEDELRGKGIDIAREIWPES